MIRVLRRSLRVSDGRGVGQVGAQPLRSADRSREHEQHGKQGQRKGTRTHMGLH
jgi:hypothetical protein